MILKRKLELGLGGNMMLLLGTLLVRRMSTGLRHCLKLGVRRTGTCLTSNWTRRCANSKIEELEPLPGELVKLWTALFEVIAPTGCRSETGCGQARCSAAVLICWLETWERRTLLSSLLLLTYTMFSLLLFPNFPVSHEILVSSQVP